MSAGQRVGCQGRGGLQAAGEAVWVSCEVRACARGKLVGDKQNTRHSRPLNKEAGAPN